MIYGKATIYTTERKIGFVPDRNEYLVACAKGKDVLHVGCTDHPITASRIRSGTFLHLQISDVSKSTVGIDISEEGVTVCSDNDISNVIKMNAESIDLDSSFDVIIAGDVMEHMSNPGLFLERVPSLLTGGGELIISVPSAYSFNVLKMWLFGKEQVHRDHTFYFSPKTLISLCSRYGLVPVKLCFSVQTKDEYESTTYVTLRNLFLRFVKTMSPTLIMHFRAGTQRINQGQCLELL